MKKEQIMELIPELSEEQAEAIIGLYEESIAELKAELESAEGAADRALEEAYARGAEEAEKKFHEAEFERLLEEELEKSGAKNVKALRALLDMEKVSLDDGGLTGLSEQLKALKAECDYLFSEDAAIPKFTSAASPGGDKLDLSKLSYKERLRLYTESPELYRSLAR